MWTGQHLTRTTRRWRIFQHDFRMFVTSNIYICGVYSSKKDTVTTLSLKRGHRFFTFEWLYITKLTWAAGRTTAGKLDVATSFLFYLLHIHLFYFIYFLFISRLYWRLASSGLLSTWKPFCSTALIINSSRRHFVHFWDSVRFHLSILLMIFF